MTIYARVIINDEEFISSKETEEVTEELLLNLVQDFYNKVSSYYHLGATVTLFANKDKLPCIGYEDSDVQESCVVEFKKGEAA